MSLMTIVTPINSIYPARFGVGGSVALGTRYRQYANSWCLEHYNRRHQTGDRGIFAQQAVCVSAAKEADSRGLVVTAQSRHSGQIVIADKGEGR